MLAAINFICCIFAMLLLPYLLLKLAACIIGGIAGIISNFRPCSDNLDRDDLEAANDRRTARQRNFDRFLGITPKP